MDSVASLLSEGTRRSCEEGLAVLEAGLSGEAPDSIVDQLSLLVLALRDRVVSDGPPCGSSAGATAPQGPGIIAAIESLLLILPVVSEALSPASARPSPPGSSSPPRCPARPTPGKGGTSAIASPPSPSSPPTLPRSNQRSGRRLAVLPPKVEQPGWQSELNANVGMLGSPSSSSLSEAAPTWGIAGLSSSSAATDAEGGQPRGQGTTSAPPAAPDRSVAIEEGGQPRGPLSLTVSQVMSSPGELPPAVSTAAAAMVLSEYYATRGRFGPRRGRVVRRVWVSKSVIRQPSTPRRPSLPPPPHHPLPPRPSPPRAPAKPSLYTTYYSKDPKSLYSSPASRKAVRELAVGGGGSVWGTGLVFRPSWMGYGHSDVGQSVVGSGPSFGPLPAESVGMGGQFRSFGQLGVSLTVPAGSGPSAYRCVSGGLSFYPPKSVVQVPPGGGRAVFLQSNRTGSFL